MLRYIKERYIKELKIKEPYCSLFKIDTKLLDSIQEDIKENGYDESKPISIWGGGHDIVIDGHIRLKALKNLGMMKVPVVEQIFTDKDEALQYALHHQRDRRTLNDAEILDLVERFDKIYPRGGDRRSKFVNQNIENPDSKNENKNKKFLTMSEKQSYQWNQLRERLKKESSRDVTARLIGISADKVSQCRHVLQECTIPEIRKIRYGSKSIHEVYKESLAAVKREEKNIEKQETNRKKLQELKIRDFPSTTTKKGMREYGMIVRILDNLVLKLLPKLEKHKSDMYNIRNNIEHFRSKSDEVFEIFCDRVPVKRFLGSLFVSDFIEVLRLFGYKILTPSSLKVINEERVVRIKKKRPVPPPHANIARVHEVGFISKADRREMDSRWERIVECDIREGHIKVDE